MNNLYEEDQREAQHWRDEWNKFISHPCWLRLMEVADRQIKNRTNTVLSVRMSQDEIFEQEFMKGEIAGIELFKKMPVIEVGRLDPIAEGTENA